MELLQDTHIWFLLSFLGFLALAWKFAVPSVLKSLDGRIEKIREEIQTSENLRIEAQELLAQYQRKHRDAVKESKKIIENAQKSAAKIRKDADAALDESMQRREKQLEERLSRMKQAAIGEIQQYAADLATQATAEIIAEKLDRKANEKLVDRAIEAVGDNLH